MQYKRMTIQFLEVEVEKQTLHRNALTEFKFSTSTHPYPQVLCTKTHPEKHKKMSADMFTKS